MGALRANWTQRTVTAPILGGASGQYQQAQNDGAFHDQLLFSDD
jgi:hypothetical protein